MWLNISCSLKFAIDQPTPFVFMLRPRSGAQQWIASEEYKLLPCVQVFEFTDDFGNLCQRLTAPAGDFSVFTAAQIMTADAMDEAPQGQFVEIQNLPYSALKYLLPSRYCESDRFGDLARDITAGYLAGYDQVVAIEDWLHHEILYQPGSSSMPLSASEVFNSKIGVCRDLAHLGIALCRSISIPSRMVVGYLYGLQPMEMHAWFEVFVADRWYTFDPTQAGKKAGYVAIGFGRDAADVAVYNQFGPGVFPLEQLVQVNRV